MKDYSKEAESLYKDTTQYQEYKSKKYSKDKENSFKEQWNDIFYEFSLITNIPSEQSNELVVKLKNFINTNFYSCDNETLQNLGELYVSDDRFTEFVNKYGKGTAEKVKQSIDCFINNGN